MRLIEGKPEGSSVVSSSDMAISSAGCGCQPGVQKRRRLRLVENSESGRAKSNKNPRRVKSVYAFGGGTAKSGEQVMYFGAIEPYHKNTQIGICPTLGKTNYAGVFAAALADPNLGLVPPAGGYKASDEKYYYNTMGQMAIRIALQCNEADAYLIMDENNPAPRLLSRPGEGIYNDMAGMIEGNSPFQVAWLPDEVRNRCLDRAGFGNCSNHGECEAVCPKGISISNIARLNREFIKAALASRENLP